MTHAMALFTFFLLLIKTTVAIYARFYIDVESKDIIACNMETDKGQVIYFLDQTGLLYVSSFGAQMLLSAFMLHVTVYEGALKSDVFATCCGGGGKNTTIFYYMFFCRSPIDKSSTDEKNDENDKSVEL